MHMQEGEHDEYKLRTKPKPNRTLTSSYCDGESRRRDNLKVAKN